MNIILILVILAAVGGLVYYFKFYRQDDTPPNIQPTPSAGTWAIQFSHNMPAEMTRASDGTYFFDFPDQNGVHYVVENAPPLAIGRVITLKCSITGNGTIVPTEYPEHGPLVRLFMQRAGDDMSGTGQYQQYRYWSVDSFVPAIGDFELSVPLNADRWVDVGTKPGTEFQSGFIGCVSNASVIGFTFGGDMAGHGDYVVNGTARFILKSFTIT